ncbi:MAG: AAA family ATPase, partial [Candidatus Saccharibacteria bacterium]|nr:AAA family ATPase [Candidatus Saccharibacteria bacterium]
MAKLKTRYQCQNCGANYAKWVGRCENCGEWNTLLEQAASVEAEAKSALAKGSVSGKRLDAVSINTIEPSDAGSRLTTGFADLDLVLGGGILLGGVALLAGQPGMGKSTILMQICATISGAGHKVLYVSGEESAGQVKMRAVRLGASSDDLHFASSSSANDIAKTIEGGE